MEVRNAAVESISQLAIQSREFGLKSIEFLIDMFNDEQVQIRISAVISLEKMASQRDHHLYLDINQLEAAVLIIQDASSLCRQSAHRMLCVYRMKDSDGLLFLSKSLLKNWSRYPDDKESILKCFASLGRRNSAIVGSYIKTKTNRIPCAFSSKYSRSYLSPKRDTDGKP
jgi:integrator complex subunit 4